MITRTIKYTASDGTEHDSPQAAATVSLAQTILHIADTFEMANERMAEKLSLNPEALRDAVSAYFEDLEDHPDVDVTGTIGQPLDPDRMSVKVNDHRICAICDGGPGNNCACTCGMKKWTEPDPTADCEEPPHPSGLKLTDVARRHHPDRTLYDWLSRGWTPKELLEDNYAVLGTVGDKQWLNRTGIPSVRKDHPCYNYRPMPIRGDQMEVTLSNHRSGVFGGGFVSWTQPPTGNPDDPTTWRADLPVDHPSYCRPFGTRED